MIKTKLLSSEQLVKFQKWMQTEPKVEFANYYETFMKENYIIKQIIRGTKNGIQTTLE